MRKPLVGGYDPVATDYFNRAKISNSIEKSAVNYLVKNWKSRTTLWNSSANGVANLCSPTSFGASMHNLFSSSFQYTLGTAPGYSTTGRQYDGVASFLKTGYIPSVNMTLNTGFILVYCRTNSASTTFPLAATNSSGTQQWGCILRNANNPNLAQFRAFDGASQAQVTNTDSSGVFVFSCTANNNRFIMRNGTVLTTDTNTLGGALTTFELYEGARNLAGTASNFSPYEIATVIQGPVGISVSDAQYLTTLINTYNATVIPGGR